MNSHKLIFGLVAILVSVGIFLLSSNEPPKLTKKGYDLAIATYGACMAKSEARLENVKKMLDDTELASELSADETRWLRRLVETAPSEWAYAAKAVKLRLEQQVEY